MLQGTQRRVIGSLVRQLGDKVLWRPSDKDQSGRASGAFFLCYLSGRRKISRHWPIDNNFRLLKVIALGIQEKNAMVFLFFLVAFLSSHLFNNNTDLQTTSLPFLLCCALPARETPVAFFLLVVNDSQSPSLVCGDEHLVFLRGISIHLPPLPQTIYPIVITYKFRYANTKKRKTGVLSEALFF